MLVEFRVRNYRSIAEEVHLSMVAGRGSEHPNHTFEAPEIKQKLLRSVVLFGANGSGKSNVVAALRVLQMIVAVGATRLAVEDPIPVRPFLLDGTLAAEPTRFEVLFIAPLARERDAPERRSLFRYVLAATSNEIVEESLEAWPKGRLQTWFARKKGAKEIAFGDQLLGDKRQIERLTRPNCPYLSAAAQNNHRQLAAVHEWFRKDLRFLAGTPDGAESLRQKPKSLPGLRPAPFTADRAGSDQEFHAIIEKIMRFADTGLDTLRVKRTKLGDVVAAEALGELAQRDLEDNHLVEVKTTHKRRDGEEPVQWDLDQESEGTQRLFDLAGPWVETILNDYVLAVDEAFNTLHPALTRRLLEQLHKVTPSRAQVIMTSHDLTLLDQALLRRDQIWFTEKKDGATALYSMMDFDEEKPRKGEVLMRKYLLGKYGAVPLSRAFPTVGRPAVSAVSPGAVAAPANADA